VKWLLRISLNMFTAEATIIVTGMMAHSKTESWLTCTGQAAHLGADYSLTTEEKDKLVYQGIKNVRNM